MNWDQHKKDLSEGKTVQCRPKGSSMKPKINSEELITIEPIANHSVQKNDIVFCRVKGNYYVHLVTSVKTSKNKGDRYQISNNKKRVNGTIGIDNIYGKVVKVEP